MSFRCPDFFQISPILIGVGYIYSSEPAVFRIKPCQIIHLCYPAGFMDAKLNLEDGYAHANAFWPTSEMAGATRKSRESSRSWALRSPKPLWPISFDETVCLHCLIAKDWLGGSSFLDMRRSFFAQICSRRRYGLSKVWPQLLFSLWFICRREKFY